MTRTNAILVVAAVAALAASTPRSAHAQGLQLEATILDGSGVLAGVWLEGDVALLTGIRAAFLDTAQEGYDPSRMSVWEVPLEAKIYLGDVAPHALVPTVLAGAGYGRMHFGEGDGFHVISARLLLGVDYWIDDVFAAQIGLGAMYRRSFAPDAESTEVYAIPRVGIVLRP